MNDFALRKTGKAAGTLAVAEVPARRTAVEHRTPNVRLSPETAQVPTSEQVKAVVEQIDSYLKAASRELQFQVDDESGEIIVRVRDPATGEVIRQIPGEEVLRMARALQEKPPVLLDLVV